MTIGEELEIERRLRDLPMRCARLLAGLDNAEDDATLVFDGLPWSRVAKAVITDRDVWRALPRCATQPRWTEQT